ncbi:MAG: entry exclusion lipoprotein TrbK [Betaproteobacteria bacterium]|nr:entry exclusion lipoprotein TrbK [Betaproteobacteria bacterium]
MKGKIVLWAAFVAAGLAGCGRAPMPEVNDANCQIDKIMQIKDEATRREFGSLCSRQPGAIAPTEKPKNWLDLTDPGKKR